jgi:hypothetical protein
VQRHFEDRLAQQLGDMDVSIRRNFDKVLGHHLGPIRRAHADAQERLEGDMLDIVVVVRRLEEKLDRIAESVRWAEQQWGPECSSAPQRWNGSHPGTERQRQSAGGESGKRGGEENYAHTEARGGRGDPRTLMDVIDKVCASNGRGGALVRQRMPPPATTADTAITIATTVPHQIRGGDACADPSPASEQQAASVAVSAGLREPEAQRESLAELHRPVVAREEGRMEHGADWQSTNKKVEALSDSISKKLERIAYALGIRNLNVVDNSADDSEDRKRLMEKLKSAFDNDRRRRSVEEGTDRDKWLDYIFGICKPDQRIGKRGSRCLCLSCSQHQTVIAG